MNLKDAMYERHSVRAYEDRPIDAELLEELEALIRDCNEESGLHIQLVTNEPKAFQSLMARYGQFKGVTNYIAMVGPKSPSLDELCGYYGEKIVLRAQMMGLRTCWVGATYKKIPDAFEVAAGEKLVIVITIGYGLTDGTPHKSRKAGLISNVSDKSPLWFRNGIRAALLAPTAMNQQKFKLDLEEGHVKARAGIGPYAKVDLGIVKYHFEVAAGKENFTWK